MTNQFTPSHYQLREAYTIVGNILESFDDLALKELMSGSEKDLDTIIELLVTEAKLIVTAQNKLFDPGSFGYMDKFTESVEMTLRCRSLAYFILACMPEFIMEWFHLEWCNLAQLHQFLNILCARGHSKSFFWSKAYPIWMMYKYKRSTLLNPVPWELEMGQWGIIVTNEQSLANSFLGLIKAEIETNDIIGKVLLPDNRNEGWKAESIVAKTGALLQAKSFGAKIRGTHPTYFILDDYLNESSLYSLEQRKKYSEKFSGSISPALIPGGQLVVVGTPFAEQDLYAELRDSGEYLQFKYPAIDSKGALLSPQRFDYQHLMSQKNILGSLRFSREILCEPISDGSTIFPYSDLDKATIGMESMVLITRRDNSVKKYEKVVVGIDFAISSAIGADYFCVIILGIDKAGHYYLLNALRRSGMPYKEQIEHIVRINRDFRPDVIQVENNGFQVIYETELKERGLPIRGRTTTGVNKKSLYTGVPSLAVLFQNGLIHFPTGNEESKNTADWLKGELNSITFIVEKGKLESVNQHDDGAMALWQAVSAHKDFTEGFNFQFL